MEILVAGITLLFLLAWFLCVYSVAYNIGARLQHKRSQNHLAPASKTAYKTTPMFWRAVTGLIILEAISVVFSFFGA